MDMVRRQEHGVLHSRSSLSLAVRATQSEIANSDQFWRKENVSINC